MKREAVDSEGLKNKALNGTLWKYAERIGAQAVSLVVSIILARMLVPDDYSVVGIVAIFFNFSNVIISGGFNAALIQKKETDELDYSSVLSLTLVMSLIVYAVLFFCAPVIARIYDKDLLVPVIRVMSLVLFVNSFKSVLSAKVSRGLSFRIYFFSTLGGTLVSAVVGIVMAYRGFGPWALVAQQMTNSCIDTLILTISCRYRPSFRVSLSRLRALFGFGGRIYLTSIITVIYDEIKPLIVGIRFTTEDLAYYNKGKSFPWLLNSSITDTLSAVLFPVMSKVQDDKEAVRNMARRFMCTVSYVVFPLMVGLFAVADTFVSVVLTDKWLPIVPYIRIFSFSAMFNIIQVGNLQAIKAIGRSDISLKLEIIKKTSYFIVILLFVLFSDSPVVLAVSGIVTTVIASLVNAYPNRKLIGYGYRNQVADLLPNLILSVLMGAVVMLMNSIRINGIVLMILQIVVGVVVYVGLSIVTKNRNLKYLAEIVRERLPGKAC